MAAQLVRLLAPLFTAPPPASPSAPPTEFKIWAFGDIDTEKGKFKLTKASAGELMKRAERWGNDFPIDWGHSMLDGLVVDPAEAGKAAGWFTPELRDDGLWATKVRWTPLALKKLAELEYRYFSPAFNHDDKGAITGLTNIALTNLPATRDMDPLVAHARPGKEKPMDPELKKFLEQLQADINSKIDKRLGDLAAGVTELKQRLDQDDGDEEMSKLSDEQLADVDDDDDDTKKKKAAERKKRASNDGAKVRCKKCGAKVAVPAASSIDVSPERLDKLDDESAEAKRGFKAELLKLSGKATTSEALGIVLGWKAAAEKSAGLEAELAKVKGQLGDGELEKIIAAAEKEGKVTPAMRSKLLEMGKKDLKVLQGFLSVAPRVAPEARREAAPGAGGKGGEPPPENSPSAELTDEDRHVAQLLGTSSPEQLKELSKRKRELGDIPRLQ